MDKKNTVLYINDEPREASLLQKQGSEVISNQNYPQWYREIWQFILEWISDRKYFTLFTSGSTGEPKPIDIPREAMIQSAEMTAEFFQLTSGDTILLCLPARYIAGKMMIVRAFVSGLNLHLTEPSREALQNITEEYRFISAVPMQVQSVLHNIPWPNIETLLLGGGPITPELENHIRDVPASVYHSYGMTETVTHVAIRKLNGAGASDFYTALPGVKLESSRDGCLIIEAPHISGKIHTNDVVTLRDNTYFRWLGRKDNIINSGGIKLYPEAIEKKLSGVFTRKFFIAGLPDEKYGEKAVLFVKGTPREDETSILHEIRLYVNKYEIPKEIRFLPEFKSTESGKIRRKATVVAYRDSYNS